jgi:hypothetical protein
LAITLMIEIRGFNPKLRHAEQQLETLRTPEGEPVPANTLAELKRDMQRRRFLCDQPVDPAIGTTHLGQRIVECVVLTRTRSAEGIMASGHVNRTNRPNTWLLRPLLHP